MESFASYLPASVFNFLLEESGSADAKLTPPLKQTYSTCVLFADISGFTALCEAMSMKYPRGGGDEFLAKRINSYFELLLRTLSSQGGDVFKFAGDAILVVWPPSEEDLTTRTRRAAQSALEVKKILADASIGSSTDTVALNVKIGVGVGEITILHVGGVFGRMEYLATGAPLIQAFHAEHQADKKDAVISAEAWALVEPFFHAEIREDKAHKGDGPPEQYAFLVSCEKPLRKVSVHKRKDEKSNIVSPAVLRRIMNYVPGAIVPWVAIAEERWASELRRVTVLFVNVGMKEAELANISANNDINTVQRVLHAVQHEVYRFEGSLNKFLMDDKGSTLIAVFGLPPLAHEDDTVRGVLSALAIVNALWKLGLKPAIGVTSGMAFCGVVGKSGSRREYSVLGDTVNLSARLMQHATANGMSVLCDQVTQLSAKSRINFDFCSKITVKGKIKPVSTYKPVPQTENRILASLSAIVTANAVAEGAQQQQQQLQQQTASAGSGSSGAAPGSGAVVPSAGFGASGASSGVSRRPTVPQLRRLGSGISTGSVMMGCGVLETERNVVSSGLKSSLVVTADPNAVSAALIADAAATAASANAIASANNDSNAPAAGADDESGRPRLSGPAGSESLVVVELPAGASVGAPCGPARPGSARGDRARARSKSKSISVSMPNKRLTQSSVVVQRIFSREDDTTDSFGHQARYVRAPSERPGVADLTALAVTICPDLLPSLPARMRSREAWAAASMDLSSVDDSTAAAAWPLGVGGANSPNMSLSLTFNVTSAGSAASPLAGLSTAAASFIPVFRDSDGALQGLQIELDAAFDSGLTSIGGVLAAVLERLELNSPSNVGSCSGGAGAAGGSDARAGRVGHITGMVYGADSDPPSLAPQPSVSLVQLGGSQTASVADAAAAAAAAAAERPLVLVASYASLNSAGLAGIEDTVQSRRFRASHQARCAVMASDLPLHALSPLLHAQNLRTAALSNISLGSPQFAEFARHSVLTLTLARAFDPAEETSFLASRRDRITALGLSAAACLNLATPLVTRRVGESQSSARASPAPTHRMLAIDLNAPPTLAAINEVSPMDPIATPLSFNGSATAGAPVGGHSRRESASLTGSSSLLAPPAPVIAYMPSVQSLPSVLTAMPHSPSAQLKGRVVLVEGEMGVGKSLLLDLVMDSSLLPALIVVANPLDTRKLALWGSLLYQLLEAELLIARQLQDSGSPGVCPLFGSAGVPRTPSASDRTVNGTGSGNGNGNGNGSASDAAALRSPPTVAEGNEEEDDEEFTNAGSTLQRSSSMQNSDEPSVSISDSRSVSVTGPSSGSNGPATGEDLLEADRLRMQSRVLATAAAQRRAAVVQRFAQLFTDGTAQHEMEPGLYAMHGQLEGKLAIPDAPLPALTASNYERYICVLGDILPELQFTVTPEVQELSPARRFLLLEVFMFVWLRSAATRCGLALTIDSAVHMDASSWAVCAAMPLAVPNVLLVIATRPINRLHLGAFTTTTPPGYLALCADTDTVKMTLTARVSTMAEEIFTKCLIDAELELADGDGYAEYPAPATVIAAMPTPMRTFIAHTGQGNPLVMSQLVPALKSAQLLWFGENYKLNVSQTLAQYPEHEIEISVPVALQAIYGSRLDRLNQTQSMLLKFAACVGNAFTLDIIAQPYPLDVTSADLARELRVLVELGIVRRVFPGSHRWLELQKSGMTFDAATTGFGADPLGEHKGEDGVLVPHDSGSGGGGDDDHLEFGFAKSQQFKLRPYPDECIYMFSQGFMREMILSRILLEQKSWIVKKIELSYSEELERRGIIAPKALLYGPAIMQDDLSVRRARDDSDEFQTLHFVLHRDLVTVWDSEEHYATYVEHAAALSAAVTAAENKHASAAEDRSDDLDILGSSMRERQEQAERARLLTEARERLPLNENNQYCPIGVLPLHAARIEPDPRGAAATASGVGLNCLDGSSAGPLFCIEASRFAKRGDYHTQPAQFIITGNSLAMVNSWRSALERGCEQAAARAASDGARKRLRQKVANLMMQELTKPIQYTADEQTDARRGYHERLQHRQTEVLSAQLLVHKNKTAILGSGWKPRNVVLTGDTLQFRKGDSTGLYRPPSQACSLNEGNVRVRSVPAGTYKGQAFVVEVTVELWSKDLELFWSSRPFVVALPSEAVRVTWITELERIVRHHVHERIRNKFKDMLALSSSTSDAAASTVPPASPGDAGLTSPAHSHGHGYEHRHGGHGGTLGVPGGLSSTGSVGAGGLASPMNKRGSFMMTAPAFGPNHSIGAGGASAAAAVTPAASTPTTGGSTAAMAAATQSAGGTRSGMFANANNGPRVTIGGTPSTAPTASPTTVSPAAMPSIKVVSRDALRHPPSALHTATHSAVTNADVLATPAMSVQNSGVRGSSKRPSFSDATGAGKNGDDDGDDDAPAVIRYASGAQYFAHHNQNGTSLDDEDDYDDEDYYWDDEDEDDDGSEYGHGYGHHRRRGARDAVSEFEAEVLQEDTSFTATVRGLALEAKSMIDLAVVAVTATGPPSAASASGAVTVGGMTEAELLRVLADVQAKHAAIEAAASRHAVTVRRMHARHNKAERKAAAAHPVGLASFTELMEGADIDDSAKKWLAASYSHDVMSSVDMAMMTANTGADGGAGAGSSSDPAAVIAAAAQAGMAAAVRESQRLGEAQVTVTTDDGADTGSIPPISPLAAEGPSTSSRIGGFRGAAPLLVSPSSACSQAPALTSPSVASVDASEDGGPPSATARMANPPKTTTAASAAAAAAATGAATAAGGAHASGAPAVGSAAPKVSASGFTSPSAGAAQANKAAKAAAAASTVAASETGVLASPSRSQLLSPRGALANDDEDEAALLAASAETERLARVARIDRLVVLIDDLNAQRALGIQHVTQPGAPGSSATAAGVVTCSAGDAGSVGSASGSQPVTPLTPIRRTTSISSTHAGQHAAPVPTATAAASGAAGAGAEVPGTPNSVVSMSPDVRMRSVSPIIGAHTTSSAASSGAPTLSARASVSFPFNAAQASLAAAAAAAAAAEPVCETPETLGYSPAIANGLDDWGWNVLAAATDDDRLEAIVRIFISFDILRAYKVPTLNFATFLVDVMENYAANPYHNFAHAVDVTQTVFTFLTQFGAAMFLTPLERFALLMSAFGHDVRHPGTNNQYQVNARTKLALLYNDQSVLEHHHCHVLFKLLLKPESNVLVNLTSAEYKDFRSTVTSAILSTDMTSHFSLVEKLNAINEKLKTARAKARRNQGFSVFWGLLPGSTGPGPAGSSNSGGGQDSAAALVPMSPARRGPADPFPFSSSAANANATAAADDSATNTSVGSGSADRDRDRVSMSPLASPTLSHRRSMVLPRSSGMGSLPPRPPLTMRGSITGITSPFSAAAAAAAGGISGSISGGPPQVARELPLYHFVQGALSATEKAVVLNVILHAADISNASKTWQQARPWADTVCEEFFSQGDLELRHKLPVSQNGIRSETNQAQLNMNFVDFIVAPLYVSLRQLLPGTRLCCSMMAENRANWDAINAVFLRDSCLDEAGAEALLPAATVATAAGLAPGVGSVPARTLDMPQLITELTKWQRRAENFKSLFSPPQSSQGAGDDAGPAPALIAMATVSANAAASGTASTGSSFSSAAPNSNSNTNLASANANSAAAANGGSGSLPASASNSALGSSSGGFPSFNLSQLPPVAVSPAAASRSETGSEASAPASPSAAAAAAAATVTAGPATAVRPAPLNVASPLGSSTHASSGTSSSVGDNASKH